MGVNNKLLITEAFRSTVLSLDAEVFLDRDRLAMMLFEDLLKISNPAREGYINAADWSSLQMAVARLNQGVPLQYVTGLAHFYGLVFDVDHRVLIPRSETEELVYHILQQIPEDPNHKLNILDIGTGSGCIAITLKKQRPNLDITAVDLSQEALDVAALNSKKFGVDINLILDDITRIASNQLLTRQWNYIVSNPPYIQKAEQGFMDSKVLKYEPFMALFPADDDPISMYRSIISFSRKHLTEGGYLFVELNEFITNDIQSVAKENHLNWIEVINDMQGKPRILKARKVS